ncbi:hypothetical protein VPH35_017774 [Triticum aestivum]
MSTANRSMVLRATAIFFSGPTSYRYMSLQHAGGMMCRRMTVSSTLSMARAKGTSGRPICRQLGSTPKTSLQVMSKVNLRNTSCRSQRAPASAACARNGRRLFSTLSRLHRAEKERKRGAAIRSWDLARCRCQDSPSALKMPWPRTSKISANSSPLG